MPLVLSLAIHLIVFLLVIFGLPHLKSEPEIVETVPVELITNVSQLTTTNKQPVESKTKKPDETPQKTKDIKTEPKPKPPKASEPEVAPPDPQELKEPPKPDEVTEKIPDKNPPKKEPPKKDPPKKTDPKKDPKKDKRPDSQEDFNKLLEDLDPTEQQPDTENKGKKMTEPEPAPKVSRFSSALSISEMDALRQQLAQCWSVMAGARNAEDLAIDIKVVVNPDRTVQRAELADTYRYNSDSFYRAAADSALRALNNPLCTPLNLPPDKYDLWHEMTITFDPKEMF